jgi:hypothetical protein
MIKVSVTQEDINNGIPRDAFGCPVVLAIKRATSSTSVEVDGEFIIVDERRVTAPCSVDAFVTDFDGTSLRVKPVVAEFVFELPDQNSPDWTVRCASCNEYVPAADLNEDGLCSVCRQMAWESKGER